MAEPGMPAVFIDGQSNRRMPVELRIGVQLDIMEHGTVIASWPWASIRKANGRSGELRLRSVEGAELARLYVADQELAKAIIGYSPSLLKDGADGRTSTLKIVAWSFAAAISIVLVGLFGVPFLADRLAPLLPQSVENRLGDVVDKQVQVMFGNKTCTNPAGLEAYQILVAKIVNHVDLKAPVRAAVLNSGIKNAIALPGGRVYYFRGLLEEARNPDEFAGVLAHEIGHVHHRDSLRLLLQTGGTSYLFGLLFGDVTGAGAAVFAARFLLDKAHTRQAEYNADGFAIQVLGKLGRPAAPMGELLVRITRKQKGKMPSILASHPLSEDRLARMRKALPVTMGEPLL
ncbi:MAG: M48 family metallopeptidase, partial [Beijerinckiaceae bacterium]|nr:M48 family metallopeptidase [Beijerinckiaceae bacterium]